MPFSMGDEKGIDIDARVRLSMPSGTPDSGNSDNSDCDSSESSDSDI